MIYHYWIPLAYPTNLSAHKPTFLLKFGLMSFMQVIFVARFTSYWKPLRITRFRCFYGAYPPTRTCRKMRESEMQSCLVLLLRNLMNHSIIIFDFIYVALVGIHMGNLICLDFFMLLLRPVFRPLWHYQYDICYFRLVIIFEIFMCSRFIVKSLRLIILTNTRVKVKFGI